MPYMSPVPILRVFHIPQELPPSQSNRGFACNFEAAGLPCIVYSSREDRYQAPNCKGHCEAVVASIHIRQ